MQSGQTDRPRREDRSRAAGGIDESSGRWASRRVMVRDAPELAPRPGEGLLILTKKRTGRRQCRLEDKSPCEIHDREEPGERRVRKGMVRSGKQALSSVKCLMILGKFSRGRRSN